MDEIVQHCLDVHNELRRRHGVPPLIISDALMSSAQNWADTNAMNGECRVIPSGNDEIGENLFAAAEDSYEGEEPWIDWYNEKNNYDWDNPGTGSGVIDHFTQMVWKESKEIGIGSVTGSNGWAYFCCHYAPAGNIQGQYEDNVLPPSTDCDDPEESNEPEDEGEEEIEEVALGQVDLDEDYKWERRQDD